MFINLTKENEPAMEYIKKQDIINLLRNDGILLDYGLKKIKKVKMGHGSCCCCSDCGQYHDDCVCYHNEWVDKINMLEVKNLP